MATETSKRDPNYVTTLMGVDMTTGLLPTKVYVDEATHRLMVNAVISGGGASDGAIVDGVSSSIKATVLDLTDTNPLTVAIVDTNGDQIGSFGGGTQYTDAGTPPAHPVGNALLFNNGGAWAAVSAAVPLPVSGTFWQTTQPVSLASVPSHAVTNAGTFAVQATEVDGANVTLGSKADAKSTATDTTSITIMSVLKQISASVQAPPSQAVTNAGTFAVQEADGANTTLGAKADAKNTATDTTAITVMSVLKQISASVQAPPSQAVTNGGTFAVQATLQTQTDTVMVGGVNIKEINAVTPLMGNGTTGTGSLRVTIASDNTAFSVNATLAAETTKVIGVVRNSDGAGNLLTSNSTATAGKFGLDSNILSILGTAPTTAGKLDVKGADGDVFVRQTTAANLNATVVQGTPAAVTAGWPVINGELADTTGTFTNATQTTSVTTSGSLDGYESATISINGTFNTATAVFEGSDDGGTTWYSLQAARTDSATVENGYTGLTNTNRMWTLQLTGLDTVRVRSTAVTSGTVNVRISISSAPTGDASVTSIGSALPTGANVIGALTANQTVNVAQINGVTPLMGVGATGTGAQRVVEANNAGKTLATVSGTAASSGNNTLKAAGTNALKVYAFSLTTTSATSTTCIFQSGAGGTELWRVVLQAPTSVNVGANLAVTPPAYLFATASATLLNLNLSGAQTIHYSVAYYDEA